MQVWAVANQKGGVGKTTTAVSLGGLLADASQRVLLIDLDPHGSLTSYFKYDPDELETSVYDLFQPEVAIDKRLLERLIMPTSNPHIDMIPATTALATLERKSVSHEGMGLQVAKALRLLKDQYDYVLIDSPPVLGVLMINALAASSHLLVPVQTEFLALKGLERMLRTINMINRARKRQLNYTLIPTFYDRAVPAAVSALRELHQRFPEQIASAVVPVDSKFITASAKGVTPSAMDLSTPGVQAYIRILRGLAERSRV